MSDEISKIIITVYILPIEKRESHEVAFKLFKNVGARTLEESIAHESKDT